MDSAVERTGNITKPFPVRILVDVCRHCVTIVIASKLKSTFIGRENGELEKRGRGLCQGLLGEK